MRIQELVSDVRTRVGSAGKQYQSAFKAYVDAQRKAMGIVTKNGQTLATTEIGAAKNIFAAAKASFDKARTDGVRKVANNPQAYVPNGRDQIVSAYKDTIDLLVKTGNELGNVVSNGYKSVLGKLSGQTENKPAKRTTASAKKASTSSAGKASASKSSTAKSTKTTAAKRKTASTRKSAASADKSSANGATTRKRSTAKKTATATSTGDSAS